ncbi:MAG: hypothetical protein J6F31_01675 [Oscillospiraceae bacterium]|nr:hypothetical protein [Oscillospiraceae bacterium]
MSIFSERIKGFLGLSGPYSEAASYLASHDYNDEYIEMLRAARENAKGKKREEGTALIAQGLLFKGELKAAAEEFSACDPRKLPKSVGHIFVNNRILCLFLLDRFREADEVYREYNSLALGEKTVAMRRTIGIREHCAGRYENAVEIFVKALSAADRRHTVMVDLCLVRSMLRLDMYERAGEIAKKNFSAYYGKGELTALVKKAEMKIQTGARSTFKGKKKKRK